MSQYYLPRDLEDAIKFHIPFTPYYLGRFSDGLWRIFEKELIDRDMWTDPDDKREYHYRYL